MTVWIKLLASVIVATSGVNRAIVQHFNHFSSELCKYAHENHVYRCPAIVQQGQSTPHHQCRTGSRTLNIPDRPIVQLNAPPQSLPKHNSTLYNTFDELVQGSKHTYPTSSRQTLPLIIALQILLGSAACLYPVLCKSSSKRSKPNALLIKILVDYVKAELAKSEVPAPLPSARLPLCIEYNIHDSPISSIIATKSTLTTKIFYFDSLTLATIVPIPNDDSDFQPASIPLPEDKDEDFDLLLLASLTPLPNVNDEDLFVDPIEVPLPDNDDGLVIDPTTVSLPDDFDFDFDPLYIATITPLPYALQDELYVDPITVALPFSDDKDLDDLYLASQTSLPSSDDSESFELDPLNCDLPIDDDDALDLLLDSLDILTPIDYTASGPSTVVDSQPSIQQQYLPLAVYPILELENYDKNWLAIDLSSDILDIPSRRLDLSLTSDQVVYSVLHTIDSLLYYPYDNYFETYEESLEPNATTQPIVVKPLAPTLEKLEATVEATIGIKPRGERASRLARHAPSARGLQSALRGANSENRMN